MIQGIEDMFLRTASGLYVAWSLDVPSRWGEWALVEVILSQSRQSKPGFKFSQVVPNRAMYLEEVQILRGRPLLFWGMKVVNAPWALVMCQKTAIIQSYSFAESGYADPNRAIGV